MGMERNRDNVHLRFVGSRMYAVPILCLHSLSPCAAKVRRMVRKSKVGVGITQSRHGPKVLLKYFQPLGRRQRQHPANQCKIDAVRAMARPVGAWRNCGIRLIVCGHIGSWDS